MVRKQGSLAQAMEGYFIAALARRLLPATLAEYGYSFQLFTRFLGDDPSLADITPDYIRACLDSWDGVSKKTLADNWTGLSALWTWAEQGLAEAQVVREVRRPQPERREIVPYSEADVRAMLGACERSRPYGRPGKAKCDHVRPTALRDRAILLVLVDTGVRASELCEMRIYQVDLRNRRITVRATIGSTGPIWSGCRTSAMPAAGWRIRGRKGPGSSCGSI